MKFLAATVFALASAQAPSPTQACNNCIGFNDAVLNMCELNDKMPQTWANEVQNWCNANGGSTNECTILYPTFFTGILGTFLNDTAQAQCSELTYCQNTYASDSASPFSPPTPIEHCTPCKNYMTDLANIAKFDPTHFHQIYTVAINWGCAGLPNFEQKACYSKFRNDDNEKSITDFIASIDPKDACEWLYFC
ncbi:unnamed protein product [Oikopleura dioica]|uniref:Saposin B-type domain-containing protein n=1 Tax=Oikopleura dioica TaxID=34765 RepID=E4XF54_OIKDI|nr:unnamed protein product [Oikopleura dioica]